MKHFIAILLLSLPSWGQLVGGNFCTASTSSATPSCTISVGTTGADVTAGHTLMVLVVNSKGGTTFTVTDTLGNTFVEQGGSALEWGGGFPACGGIGAICASWVYKTTSAFSGADTITFNDSFSGIILYVAEFAGIGSFDVLGLNCDGGNNSPCNGPAVGGVRTSSPFTTTNASDWAFAICACNNQFGGCAGVPTADATYTSRASVSNAGGNRAVFFDKQLSGIATYTTDCNVGGAATNYGLYVMTFGFTPQAKVNHRSIWE
jgi:hypothetical protein